MHAHVCVYVCVCVLNHSDMSDSASPWTVARQGPLSMGVSGHEYWGGLRFPPSGDLPDPGIESESLVSTALVGRFFTDKGSKC